MDQKKIVEWLLAILRAEDSLAMLAALWRGMWPGMDLVLEAKVKDGINKCGEAAVTNLFLRKRRIAETIFGVFKRYYSGKPIQSVCIAAEAALKIDLPQFAEGLRLARTETEMCEVLALCPESFQEEMFLVWFKLKSFDNDRAGFRSQSLKKAKEIILRAAEKIPSWEKGESDLDWLRGIPLLPYELCQAAINDYREKLSVFCEREDLDDCFKWNESNVRENIKEWLSNF